MDYARGVPRHSESIAREERFAAETTRKGINKKPVNKWRQGVYGRTQKLAQDLLR